MKKILLFGAVTLTVLALFSAPALVGAETTCVPHASTKCVSNISYWYNSCNVLEAVNKNCGAAGQVCQNGQCVTPTPAPTPTPTPNPTPTPSNQTPAQQGSGLSLTLFASPQSAMTSGWQKTLSVANNDKIDFFLIVKNISSTPVNNVMVKIDSIDSIVSIDNVKLNNAALNQSITTGVNLNTIDPKNSHIISFTATVLPSNTQNMLQVAAHVNSGETTYDSDYLTLNITPSAATPVPSNGNSLDQGSITPTTTVDQPTTAGAAFAKNLRENWYIWLAVVILLVAVFVIIFRKLSSDN